MNNAEAPHALKPAPGSKWSLAWLWQDMLILIHAHILDRRLARLERFPVPPPPLRMLWTSRDVAITDSLARRPVPYAALRAALQMVGEDFSRFTFLDLGAGHGRALLNAATYPFAAIRGIVSTTALFEICDVNIRQFPRTLMKCRDVACEKAVAARLQLPDTPMIVLADRHVSEATISAVAKKLLAAAQNQPRPIYLLLFDHRAPGSITGQPNVRQLHSSRDAFWQRLFWPVSLDILRFG